MGARGGRRGREVVAATGDGIGGAGRRGIGPLPDPEPAERGGALGRRVEEEGAGRRWRW